MKRNCNSEFKHPSSSSSYSLRGLNGERRQPQPQPQEQMTIFYNGRICVCDVTELKARSIIWFASAKAEQEKEEEMRKSPRRNPITPTLESHLLHSPTGLSMKRSLRQFLEKRRHRIQSTSPYHR